MLAQVDGRKLTLGMSCRRERVNKLKKGYFNFMRICSECFSAVNGIIMMLIPLAVYKSTFLAYFNAVQKTKTKNAYTFSCFISMFLRILTLKKKILPI